MARLALNHKRLGGRPSNKPYSHHSMRRYDHVILEGINTVWACKYCLSCCLNEETARNHVKTCVKGLAGLPPVLSDE